MDPYFFSKMNTRRLLKENPEKYSYRLWGRINPSYIKTKFISESHQSLLDHYKVNGYEPPKDRRYFTKIHGKDYKNALAQYNRIMRNTGASAR